MCTVYSVLYMSHGLRGFFTTIYVFDWNDHRIIDDKIEKYESYIVFFSK